VCACRLDTNINYRKIAYAQLHLRNRPDTLFLATNADSTFPSAGHMLPGI
jgi:4-nitrophenyl phosphatase